MASEIRVFISSKMVELLAERQVLHELLPTLGGDLVRLRAWVFEDDAPAANRPIREVYLDALKHSELYLGLFWNEYGDWTIDEFHHATEWSIDRHIYVKNVDTGQRDRRLQAFLDEQSDVISGITPKWFTTLDDLRQQVRKSLEVWLRDRLARRPGDVSAILAELSDEIPDLPPRLFGRDTLLADVRGRLEQGGRVLLQGFGGMGKSALAATAAADWLDEDRGPVLWLRAGTEKGDALLEALARAFDAHQEMAKAMDREKVKTIHRLLAEAQVSLVVLDDVWDGAALSQVLKAIPRKLPVLVTARQRFALDHIVEIRGLDSEQSLNLLSFHAGQDYSRDPAAIEMCRQVGYHAFALEIAGKTLRVDQIRPAELLRRIATTPHAIAMPQDFAEEGRTSITELLNASLYSLDDETRQVFLAFGRLFVPRVTPELLARCMERPVDEIGEDLIALQRRGLADRELQPDEDAVVYGVHDLAYSYARTVTAGQGYDPGAVIAACRAYAEAHAGDLKALDAELSNILGAAKAAQDRGDGESLVAIMGTLAGPYLSARGHTLTFIELLDAAVAVAEHLGDDEARDYLLGKRGNIYYDRGDLPNALAAYQGSLDLARRHDKQDRQARLLCAVGKVLADQGADPSPHFAEAYQIAKALDDGYLIAFVLEHQGYYAQLTRDYDAAHRYYAEEVALAERIDDMERLIIALLNLGSAEYFLSHFEEARQHHERALNLARDLDNRLMEAHALQSLGEDHHRLGDDSQARQCLAAALTIFRESGLKAKADEVEAYMKQASYAVEG